MGDYMQYLDAAESEYRTLYRKGKWTKASTPPQESGFVGEDEKGRGGGGRGRGGRGGQSQTRKKCHNCGRQGHLSRTCWAPGGGAEGQGPNRGNHNGGGNQQGEAFPGVDDAGIRNPPRPGDPRERVLPSGQEVKWCGLCGKWGDHYRAGHPSEEEVKEEEAVDGDGHVAIEDGAVEETDDPPSSGAFARLYAAGLI